MWFVIVFGSSGWAIQFYRKIVRRAPRSDFLFENIETELKGVAGKDTEQAMWLGSIRNVGGDD